MPRRCGTTAKTNEFLTETKGKEVARAFGDTQRLPDLTMPFGNSFVPVMQIFIDYLKLDVHSRRPSDGKSPHEILHTTAGLTRLRLYVIRRIMLTEPWGERWPETMSKFCEDDVLDRLAWELAREFEEGRCGGEFCGP